MKSNLKIMKMVSISSMILLALFLAACGGGGSGDGTSEDVTIGEHNTITFTGDFSDGSHAKSLWLNRFFAKISPSAHALDPNQVSKVIAFFCDGEYVVSTVTDGSFSIEVEKGSPVGMIFAGANDNFLGYLTLGNGIDSLPLNYVEDNVTTIDLDTLSSSGLVVEPSHNPLGSEIPLSSEEQNALALADDMFVATIKSPDVDGNGIIDFLEGKFFGLQILYYVNGGSFDGNLSPTVNDPADITGYKLAFDATDTNLPNIVDFTGPAGCGLSSCTSNLSNVYTGHTTYFSPYVNNPSIPPAGQYAIAYKTKVDPYPETEIKTKDSTSVYATTENAFKSPLNGQCTWYVYGRVIELVDNGYLNNTVYDKMYDAFWEQEGRHAKNWLDDGFLGNQFNWGETPQMGAIAVWKGGSYGHVAFVESVESDKTTYTVSEFNATNDETYRVKTYTTSTDNYIGDGPYFIYLSPGALSYTLPDQSAAPSNIVMPVPTVSLNDDSTIQKVNWVYRLGSGSSATLDALTIISKVELQIDGSGNPCAGYPQQGRIYNSGWLSVTTTEHVLACQTLYWSDVTRINMAYEDVYGNHNVVIWYTSRNGVDGNIGEPDLFNSVEGHAFLPNATNHSGISVSLEGASYSTMTDNTGYYYISDFPNGTYYVVASKSGYLDTKNGPWSFSNYTHHENITLYLSEQ